MCFKNHGFVLFFNLKLLVEDAALESLMIVVNYFG